MSPRRRFAPTKKSEMSRMRPSKNKRRSPNTSPHGDFCLQLILVPSTFQKGNANHPPTRRSGEPGHEFRADGRSRVKTGLGAPKNQVA